MPPLVEQLHAIKALQWMPMPMDGEEITLDFVMKMIENFKNQKLMRPKNAYQILKRTRNLLSTLPSLVDVTVPDGKHITICGDIHGQFYDLINIFDLNGYPSEDKVYLFNGDFVDRGKHSLEVVLTLFAFKCLYPSSMHLARGNHESRSINEIYGFHDEVNSKLNHVFIDLFAEVFCCLPLAHVINNKVFVVHGGLFGKDGVKLSDIRAIDRFCEPPAEGLMHELLWSDPHKGLGRGPSRRGSGLTFGPDVTRKFLEDNDLCLVVRSHEMKKKGYKFQHNGKLITVFSAPNYCGRFSNSGAFLQIEAPDLKLKPTQFSAVEDPIKEVSPIRVAKIQNRRSPEIEITNQNRNSPEVATSIR